MGGLPGYVRLATQHEREEAVIDLVCSVCGSREWYNDQRSIDDRWPIAKCRNHKGLSPLISERAFTKRERQKALDAPTQEAMTIEDPGKFTDMGAK